MDRCAYTRMLIYHNAAPMMPKFQEALEKGDLNALRHCAKSDLHNHGIGGGDRAFLLERTGRDIAPLNRSLSSIAGMHAWVDENVDGIFAGREGRLLAFEAALVLARRDGVTRLEIGEDVWASTLFDGSAAELTRELRQVHSRVAPAMEWIAQIGLSRHCAIGDLERWLPPFLAAGFYRTLDLSGDEFAQPQCLPDFQSDARTRRRPGITSDPKAL